jgi:hypothetical protein
MLAKLLDFIFGEKCPRCGSRGHRKLHSHYARGWNHRCSQANGDWGKYCESCHKVYFEISDEEFLDIQPDWCTLNGERGRGTNSGFSRYDKDFL